VLNGTGDVGPGARPAILGILNASPESISGNRFDAGTVAEAAERPTWSIRTSVFFPISRPAPATEMM